MSIERRVVDLANSFTKELEKDTPDPETCLDLLKKAGEEVQKMDASSIESSNIVKVLTKSIRSIKRHRRTSEQTDEWDGALKMVNKLLDDGKSISKKQSTPVVEQKVSSVSKKQSKAVKEQKVSSVSKKQSTPVVEQEVFSGPVEPTSVAEYRMRLVSQKKEIYKDPPALPPTNIEVDPSFCPLPKRNKETGLLSFTAEDTDVKKMLQDFHPNRTPEEVLRAGSFGGTYFRPIISAVTNVLYKPQDVLNSTVEKEWIEGLPMDKLVTATYRVQVNKFKVKCGGSLGMWESSGWITHVDPYGWFQWYCRFYRGRRCQDDKRQISRWLKSAGPKGRFRSQLCNKILAAGTTHDDKAISPVIRQTLLHWGLEITPEILAKHAKRVMK
jgi:hypothetical protein